jgi:peptidoglycan/xylan/chitin deacetylase (PgdA/CDA1 family)
MTRLHRSLSVVLLAALAVGCARRGIPDKTVVLTFDDGVRNHLTTVIPVLEEMGFGATFFICARWMEYEKHYLQFRELAEIERRGFELGDHTWSHYGFHVPEKAAVLERETSEMARAFADAGLSKPVSFAWPGDAFGPESLAVLRRKGFRFARRGMSPEFPPGQVFVGPAFDPARHDPLLIPTAGTAHVGWSDEHFGQVLSQARDGKAVVLQFHGVPDPQNVLLSLTPGRFLHWMQMLKDGGFHVIAMRDLGDYVDSSPLPSDPMTKIRCPDGE